MRSTQSCIAYKQQPNICTNLLRKIKFTFYNNLNPAGISSNNTYWKTVKPIFSDKKTSNINKLILILVLISYQNPTMEIMILYNKEKFKKHPSFIKIKEVITLDRMFTFNFINFDTMVNKMNNLDRTSIYSYKNCCLCICANII